MRRPLTSVMFRYMTQSIVRAKRLDKGWTLRQLADECASQGAPTALSNLHRIEVGDQVPRPGLRKALAKVLEMDVEEFDHAGAGVN